MKLQDMFSKDINRSINGVIKVMQTDDENRRQELEEYVITRELQKHFGAFYDHYEQGIDGPTDKIGVWISGFFGSGKSHFLKILSYLLANEEVCGKRALDYFEEKFDYDPLRYAMMRRVVKAAFSQRRKTLRNSLASMGVDKAIIAAALKEAGIDEQRRAESLSVAEFVALSDAFSNEGEKS